MNKIKSLVTINVSDFHEFKRDLSEDQQTLISHRDIFDVQQKQLNLNYDSNWLLRILITLYLAQNIDLKYNLEKSVQKIKRGQIKICCCSNQSIPSWFQSAYQKDFICEILLNTLTQVTNIFSQSETYKVKLNNVIKLIEDDPEIQFSFNLLLRAFAIENSKKIFINNTLDFLGNQIQVLKDYNIQPEYKIIGLISSALKFNIHLEYLNGESSYEEYYYTVDSYLQIKIKKDKENIRFSCSNKKPEIKKTISTECSVKDVLKNMFERTSRQKGNDLQKSASKTCPKCGQTRKPNQKFCTCRKLKIGSNSSVAGKNY